MKKALCSGHETRLDLSVNGRLRPGFTLIELLAVILILGLLMAFLGPSLAGALRQAYRGTCKTNLHELARGCTSYAGEGTLHRGTTPFALPNSSSTSSTVENTTNWGSLTEGNSAALWVLVKYGYAGTSLFYCPEAGLERGFDEPDKNGIGYPHTPVGERDEFTPTTISYSYISTVDFQYAPTTVEDESSLVILADQNPRCTLGVTGVNGSAFFNMAANASENSLNHEGDGQVIARRGGSVDWIESPTGGGDDIYAGSNPAIENEGRRGSRTDVILIP